MVNRFFNKYEEVTYEKLINACSRDNVHVFSKARLADVLPIKNSGISDNEYAFALKSHFDFVVCNKNYEPIFSVEFDGPRHFVDASQKKRDHLKNELCEKFSYPLLRINSNYLDKKYRGLDLLTYFIDVWFLREAFFCAQENGTIPYDEPFDPASIMSVGDSGEKWPYLLSLESQKGIRDLYNKGFLRERMSSSYIGKDKNGNYRCVSWIVLKRNENEVVIVETGMRCQQFPIDESDVLEMIAVCDLYTKLKSCFEGEKVSISIEAFEKKMKYYQENYPFCLISGCSGG